MLFRSLDDGEMLASVPVSLVSRIVVFGRVTLSPWLRNQALQMGIDLVFLSRRGRYMGRAGGRPHGPGDVLPCQVAAMMDPDSCLHLARRFVAGKIGNMRALLGRRAASSKDPKEMIEVVAHLAVARRHALEAEMVDELRGVEAAATRRYFDMFPLLLPDGVPFPGRNRRPPKDPVNSALGFGYAVLLSEVEAACHVSGLDPRYGFLHRPGRNRPSLALDLVGEFRPLIDDAVVLTAFRKGVLKPDRDFETSKERGCRLDDDDARRRFFGAYETRLLTEFAYVPSRTRTTYRRALLLQARQLATVLLGLRTEYNPVAWR